MYSQQEQVKVVVIEPEQQNAMAYQECRRLWEENFQDPALYVDYYFGNQWGEERKWASSTTLLLRGMSGKAYSMLHLNPYPVVLDGRTYLLHYIVGVCTSPQRRRKGYMQQLLQETFSLLYAQQEPFTFLMPASPAIYLPYGFAYFYQNSRTRRSLHRNMEAEGTEYHFLDYEEAAESDRQRLVLLSRRLLSQRFQIYVERSQEYYQDISREMRACRGQLLLVYRGDSLAGYLEYGQEDGEVEIFEGMAEGLETEDREELFTALGNYLCQMREEEELQCLIGDTEFLGGGRETSPVMMGRIIHFETCARLLSAPKPYKEYVRIRDEWIPENNGIWKLEIRGGGEAAEVSRAGEDRCPDRELTVQEFQREFFSGRKSYFNELV